MAITNVRVGTSTFSNGSVPTPCGLPASLAEGDIMIIALMANETTDGIVSLPVEWTEIVNNRSSGGLMAIWYKVWQSGDVSPTLTRSGFTTGSSAGESIVMQMLAYAGGDTANVVDLIGAISTNVSQANIGAIAAAGTLAADDIVLVVGGKCDDWTSVDLLTGDGLTWVEAGEPDTTSGIDVGMVWNYAIDGGSSTVLTDKTFTVTGGVAATGKGVMITLNNYVYVAPTNVPNALMLMGTGS